MRMLAGTEVPVIEVAGPADGPKLTVIAGVHGGEYAPMAAARRWANGLSGRLERGRVTVVPVVNMPSFLARSPFVVPDDGKNLNRSFPGNPDGTLAERLAYDIFTTLIQGSDAFVDMHAGDLVEALEPFAIYDAGPASEAARGLAISYGLRYVIREAPEGERAVSGTSSGAAAAAGIPAIIAEAGGCGLVEEQAVALHLRGLDGLLNYLGMGGRPAGGPPPTELSQFIWPRAVAAGWWSPAVRPGEKVEAGQRLGSVTTLDGGTVLEEINASQNGIVLFLTTSPAVAAGGILLGLGAA
jgi:uncharacterized protein